MSDEDHQEDLFGQPEISGKFFGRRPTETERESGTAVELRDQGPLKPGGAGHLVLRAFARYPHRRMTAYEASYLATGDWHSRRREATRLLARGYLVKDGVLPNRAPLGRPHVDAYRITPAGLSALARLDQEASP
jgi:hypothetical protein